MDPSPKLTTMSVTRRQTQENEIMPCIFSDQQGFKLDFNNNRNPLKSLHMENEKLSLLNDPCVKEEIKK